NQRCCQNGVAAQEVNLNLHGIAEPSKDVDVVPTLFVITTRRVIVDPNLVRKLTVELGIKFGLQDVLEHRKLGLLFGLKRSWILKHFAIAIAQNVGGEPAIQSDHAGLETRSQNRLNQGLAGLVVLSADWRLMLAR